MRSVETKQDIMLPCTVVGEYDPGHRETSRGPADPEEAHIVGVYLDVGGRRVEVPEELWSGECEETLRHELLMTARGS